MLQQQRGRGLKARSTESVMAGVHETVAAIGDGKAAGKNLGCLEGVRGSMTRRNRRQSQ